MHQIYVDADACPVKDEIVRVAERHQIHVQLVSNSGMFGFHGHPLVTQTVVSDGADVADDWIAERIGPGDIVVTQDGHSDSFHEKNFLLVRMGRVKG